MALVKCPECGREVSDQADACPQCGHPIARTEGASSPGGAQTMERTSKALKKQQVYSLLLSLGGLGAAIVGGGLEPPSPVTLLIGILASIIGFLWYVVIRAKIWWHHG